MISVRCAIACWLFLAAVPLYGQVPTQPYKAAATPNEAIKRIEELGGSVRKASLEGDALEVDLRHSGATDEHLQYLLALKNVAIVRLRECKVGDPGLVHLGKLSRLQKLHLEKTSVSDAGLNDLSGLKELEVLNLYGCSIGDAGLNHLHSLTKLKELYISETKVSEPGISKLRKALPKVAVVPDRAIEREQADAAWQTARKALVDMEMRFQEAKKEAEVLAPRVAELKRKVDEATKKLNEAKNKGGENLTAAQAALKLAQQEQSKAANAAKNLELAQKHLAAHRQLEADARARVEALRAK